MERKYPKNYRFSCRFEDLKRCVDISCEMLRKKQILILFGFINKVKFDILIDKEIFSSQYKDIEFQKFNEIIIEEVSVIIEQNIKEPTMVENSLEDYLKSNGCSSEDVKYIVKEKSKKRRYIKDTLMNEEAISRYVLKENTLNDKLSKISYEINRYVFEDNSDMLYSILEFTSSESLNREVDQDEILFNQKVKFVCDKYDIDYLINSLQRIKERL